jgi:nitrite reductase/ring-hydroxylating ferredoxin subunit
MFNFPKLIKLFLISWLFVTFIGCDDDNDWIPNVRVDERISLIQLADVGILQARELPGGVNGIIIFRLADTRFNAFDRTCPYEPGKNCRISFDEQVMLAECHCCGSLFELFESGAVQKGPAKRPLRQYSAVVYGSQLHISN